MLYDSQDSARFEQPVRIPRDTWNELPHGDDEDSMLARLEAHFEAGMTGAPRRQPSFCRVDDGG